MHNHLQGNQCRVPIYRARGRPYPGTVLFVCLLLLMLTACGGSTSPSSTGAPKLATRQVLILPNVGTSDIGFLDPALGPDANSALAVNMIYSGLVTTDKDLNVLPDQATWDISSDNKVYTFHLKSGITFSDGTPVTAQTYVYTLTRALLPKVQSGIATFFEGAIVGANDVNNGKTTTLTGVKAIDNQTLQITLTQPTPYFLEVLTNSIYFPLNEKLIDQHGQTEWVNYVADNGAGTGPFMVKEWDHNVKMILVPNPHYYGKKTRLSEVDMIFVKDPTTAFKSFRAGQYDLIWNITAQDQLIAKSIAGFTRHPLLQTDLLFFHNKMPPFDKVQVRQAFAYATDRNTLVHAIFKDTVTPAPTIIPPSYPNSQVTPSEAAALQAMWQGALGIQVKLRSVDLNAYNDETAKHLVQFGFTQWGADFPDPYDWLALNLLSTASNNNGEWNNPEFDQTIAQAEKMSGDARIALYNKAEQIAIEDVGWLPLDHQALAAVIPSYVHGIILNSNGLFFGDWSNVYLLQH